MNKRINLIIFYFLSYFFYSSIINSSQSSLKQLNNELINTQNKQKLKRIRRRKRKKNNRPKNKRRIKQLFKKLKQTVEETKNNELIETFNHLEKNIKEHKDISSHIQKLNQIIDTQNLQDVKKEIEENESFFDLVKTNQTKNNKIKYEEPLAINENIKNQQESNNQIAIKKNAMSESLKIDVEVFKSLGEKIKNLIKQVSLINTMPLNVLNEIIKNHQKIPKNIIAKFHPDQIRKNTEKNILQKEALRNLFINFNAYNNLLEKIEKNKNTLFIEHNEIQSIENNSNSKKNESFFSESKNQEFYNDKESLAKKDETRETHQSRVSLKNSSEEDHLVSAIITIEPHHVNPNKDTKAQNINKVEKRKEEVKKAKKEKEQRLAKKQEAVKEQNNLKKEKKNTTNLKEFINQKRNEIKKKELEEFKADQERIEDELIDFLPQKNTIHHNKNLQKKEGIEYILDQQSSKNLIEKKSKIAKPKVNIPQQSNNTQKEPKNISNRIELEEKRLKKIKEEKERKQQLNIEKSKLEKKERAARRLQRLEEEAKLLEMEYNQLESEFKKNTIKTINEIPNNEIIIKKNLLNNNKDIPDNIKNAEIELNKNKQLTENNLLELLNIKNKIKFEPIISNDIASEIHFDNKNKTLTNQLNEIEKHIKKSKENLEQTKQILHNDKQNKENKIVSVDFISLQKIISKDTLPSSHLKQKLEEIKNQNTQNINNIDEKFNKQKEQKTRAFDEADQIQKEINNKIKIEQAEKAQIAEKIIDRQLKKEELIKEEKLQNKEKENQLILKNQRAEEKTLEETQLKNEQEGIEKQKLKDNKQKVEDRKAEVKKMQEKQRLRLIEKQEAAKKQKNNTIKEKNNSITLKETIHQKRKLEKEQEQAIEKQKIENREKINPSKLEISSKSPLEQIASGLLHSVLPNNHNNKTENNALFFENFSSKEAPTFQLYSPENQLNYIPSNNTKLLPTTYTSPEQSNQYYSPSLINTNMNYFHPLSNTGILAKGARLFRYALR